MLSPPASRHHVELDDFKTEMTIHMSKAWELARTSVKKAQGRQKQQHDRRAKSVEFKPGDRVFVFMPGAKRGKAYKFARAFHGPYRIIEIVENGVILKPIDRPQADPVRVALDHIRVCPTQVPDESRPPPRTTKTKQSSVKEKDHVEDTDDIDTETSVWSGCLRSHSGRGRPNN